MMLAIDSGMTTKFETETCSRCHGTGKHSFCEMYRDVCFKCKGSGLALTKRGAVAKAYFEKLCTIPLSQVKVGDRIASDRMTNGGAVFGCIATVTKIEVGTPCNYNGNMVEYINIFTTHEKYGDMGCGMPASKTVRIYDKDNSEKLAKALEYQNSLTKQGKERKAK